MGPKKKAIGKGGKGRGKDKKEEPKKPDAKKEPMPDYDWLPKKRKPKPESEAPKEPVDDGLWLWPGDSKERPIHSITFWSTGRPPVHVPPWVKVRKKLKETDPNNCFLRDGPFVESRPPSECAEHGIVTGPGSPPEEEEEEEDRAKKVWCIDTCNPIDRMTVAECDQHGHVKTPIVLEVEAVETIDRFDIRRTEVRVPCGGGLQSLRWLGHAACTRMAFIKDEAPSKFIPLAVRTVDGHLLDVDWPIREVFTGGSHVIVDYKSGPRSYAEHWDGRPSSPTAEECIKKYFDSKPDLPILVDTPPPKPRPPKKKKKKKGAVDQPPPPPAAAADPADPDAPPPEPPPPLFFEVEVQAPTDIITFIDWPAYDVPDLLLELRGDTDEELFKVEWMVTLEILTAYSGAIEAILLWYGGQGFELEDQDFRWLNIEQFHNLFRDLNLSPVPFTENRLKTYFEKYCVVNNIPGAYQLSSWGFFPILLHLFHCSGLYGKFGIYYQPDPPVPFHEKIWHFITVILLPNFAARVKSTLEDLHSAETADSLAAIKEREEAAQAALLIVNPAYVEPNPEGEMDPNLPSPGLPDLSSPEARAASLEAAILKQAQEEEQAKTSDNRDAPIILVNAWTQVDMEVDVKILMPHFKKWRVLGDHWDDTLAAAISIYALQKPLDVFDFTVKHHGLRFGVEEIQRFLLAASHCLYGEQCKPLLRVSEHSFLRTYLQDVFLRAKVAKPLYTTYEEKLQYMRLHCFRHPEPLPPLPDNSHKDNNNKDNKREGKGKTKTKSKK